MELIDGETVEKFVERDGPMDCLLALKIAEQVACALIAAEKRHLVHRDIKPSNLMLVRGGDRELLVKVIDFGLVKSASAQGGSVSGLTADGFMEIIQRNPRSEDKFLYDRTLGGICRARIR